MSRTDNQIVLVTLIMKSPKILCSGIEYRKIINVSLKSDNLV